MTGPHGQCNIVNVHMPNTPDNINLFKTVLRVPRREVPMPAEHVTALLGDWNFTLEGEGRQKAHGGLRSPGG
eukprot:9407246-Pyramimonas_sp.AAC.1